MLDIEGAIPHRPPFLLLDRIVSIDEDRIVAESTARSDDELFAGVFRGHYPGKPITPGVLLCEMVFQAAAVLISQRLDDSSEGVPVLVRIRDARFKEMVGPDQKLKIEAALEDQVSNAFYMKGSVKCEGKLAVRVSFSCALVAEGSGTG